MRVAVATCAEYPALYEDDHALLRGLGAAGFAVEPVVWDADADWGAFDAVLLRSVWDYHLRAQAFARWLDLLDGRGVPCWNPTSLVRWNMDKRYLRDLEARDIATVPTLWIDPGEGMTPEDAAGRVLATGWRDMVVKPAVSAGAWRTLRLSRESVSMHARELGEILAGGSLLAQPFLREVEEEGEWSLVFVDGAFSHAVLKRPRAGDFRVQVVHGGSHALATPSAALISQARAVLAAAPSAGLYARVDGVLRDGRLLLMELELIEPYLFLAEAPDAVDLLVAALRRRLEPS